MRVSLTEARDRLGDLLAEAARGEEVIITGEDEAAFKLIPSEKTAPGKKRGGLGIARGQIWMAEDFDDYMP